MTEYVNFITNHWALSALFVIILIALIINESISGRFGASKITPASAVLMMNHQGAVVLDIRPEASFSGGHIIGSHHFSLDSLEKKIGSLQKYKDKPIILVCTQGQTALKAKRQLKEHGFQALVLEGGIEAWKMAGLPLVKS